jgi:recombination protein RecA
MVFTNQLRQKIGVMFGSPETTSGGMALKFYASVRLDIRRIQAIKEGGEITGNRTRVRVKKNKVAPPFRECEFDIMYNEGISKEGDVLDLGVGFDVIEKRGAFYSYKGERLAQGRENAKQALRENPALCLEIEQAIRRETSLPAHPVSSGFAVDEDEFPVGDEELDEEESDVEIA